MPGHAALQAFINTARKIYEKIEQGVFDVSNEVRGVVQLYAPVHAHALAVVPHLQDLQGWPGAVGCWAACSTAGAVS